MKRAFLFTLLVFTLIMGVFISAEASPTTATVPFAILNGDPEAPLCDGRVDTVTNDYEDVLATDGFRWRYELDGVTGSPITRLVIDFVCVADTTSKPDVLATYVEEWECTPVGAPITTSKAIMFFNGTGGLVCSGRPVKTSVESILKHLTIDLPPSVLITNLFAEGTVMPASYGPQCGSDQPLFFNQNLSYSLPVDDAGQTRMQLVNQPNSPHAFTELSGPVRITPQRATMGSYVVPNGPQHKFEHTYKGLVVNHNPVPLEMQFAMLTTETAFTIGIGESSYFCGEIETLIVDPYATIGTD